MNIMQSLQPVYQEDDMEWQELVRGINGNAVFTPQEIGSFGWGW